MNRADGQRFTDRVVVVTGGAAGIGEAICRAFASEGALVRILDLDEVAAAAVSESLGPHARSHRCDVADADAVRAVFEAIHARAGRIDVLVNNAGIARHDPDVHARMVADIRALREGGARQSLRATSTLRDVDWDRMIRVHLYGTFHCTREALRAMEEQRGGAIVNISSVAGLQGLPGSPDYSAAKGAIAAFTKSVAREVAGAGIRVNAIAPGWIRTGLVGDDYDATLLDLFLSQVPAGDMGRPEHVAALVLHLCSDEAGYTTGQVISPNGGVYT